MLFNDPDYGWQVVAGGGKDGNDRCLCPVGQPLKCRGTLDACDDVLQLTTQLPGIEYLLEQFLRGLDAPPLLEIIGPDLILSRPVPKRIAPCRITDTRHDFALLEMAS